MTPEDIRDFAVELGLGNRISDILRQGAPSVQLDPAPVGEPSVLRGSRLGGLPDLAPGVPWPRWRGEPLAFVAQLDLAELSAFPGAEVLPTEGTLSFFYDGPQRTWGFDPQDRGSFRVLYASSGTRLAEAPADLQTQYPARSLVAAPESTIPAADSAAATALGLSDAEEEAYFELGLRVMEEGTRSMVLGHPDQIQGDMQRECALVTAGTYCGDTSGYQDPRAAELGKHADEWRLLLQLGSHEDCGMMWGDAGSLYYWIRAKDLRARDFSNTWMILQCW